MEKLSCLFYLRDCVAHNPLSKTFSKEEDNTKKFLEKYKKYKLCFISEDSSITFNPGIIEQTHLIIHDFFDLINV